MNNSMRSHKKYNKLYNDKIDLHVRISKELYEVLIRLAPQIYGESRYRGALSYIVEQALKQYLLPYQHTQMHTNPKLSIREIYFQVKKKIAEITHSSVSLLYTIPEKILDLAIAEVRGSDPRTIAKWKKTFENAGLIKVVGGFRPNRIYELIA